MGKESIGRAFRRRGAPAAVVALAAGIASAGLAGPALATTSAAGTVRIHDIHGITRASAYAGKQVANVPGVVTAVRGFGSSRGFWFQDPTPDQDPRTDEALFVYTGYTTPSVVAGDSVLVSGTVDDYYAGESTEGSQPMVELEHATWSVAATGVALPPPVVLDARDVPGGYAPQAGGADIENLPLQPHRYALDLFASVQGMRVEVSNTRVVGPTDAYGELWVTTKPNQDPTPRGGTLYGSYAQNDSGRVEVTSLGSGAFPEAGVGDELSGVTIGPLDYTNYGGYEIAATTLGTLVKGTTQPSVAKPAHADQLSLATYNVENLAPSDGASKFQKLAQGIVHNLASPDIVSLEEVQDNDGETDDGVVDANVTLDELTAAIVAAGGPQYDWTQVDPVNDQDGGAPGGNIRIAFLYNPARTSLVDIPGGGPTVADGVTGHGTATNLTQSPGRVDPTNSAWLASRKPLAAEFTFRGHKVFVLGNHWVAKLGDQDAFGRFQPPTQGSLPQREQQADALHGFVKQIEKADPKADVVVLGDLNDYPFSPALRDLTAGGALDDLIETLPADQRYSYDYDGQSEDLDHILTSPAVHDPSYQVVHINAEFADQTSDHDPQLVRIRPAG